VSNVHAAFVGSVPEYYDRYLVPFFFAPFADDLILRIKKRPRLRVLELACGTGVVTERLLQSLDTTAQIAATDLNEEMLAVARAKHGKDARVSWWQADAMTLPFDDASFDAVVCQFGWMFFPDKAGAMREARRVLASGGQLAFNTWDRIETCPVPAEADKAIRVCFPANPPTFYETPFSMHDAEAIRGIAASAGFANVNVERISREGARLKPAEAASGIVRGAPFAAEIMERGGDVGAVEAAVAEHLTTCFGADPFPSPMRALAWTAVAI
jgi:ubiquinone/menaquinone biosynthesis C-methylase UbiE